MLWVLESNSTSHCKKNNTCLAFNMERKWEAVMSRWTIWTVYLHVCSCAHACLGKHMVLSGCPVAAGDIVFPFVFVQVFGDYYHFRHHSVEKRALSGHRGMHIRLQKEPQVRLVSALHSSLQHTMLATTVQKTDWITHRECVYHKRKRCQHQWQLVKLCVLFNPHQSFNLSSWPNRRYYIAVNTYSMSNKYSQTTQQLGVLFVSGLDFSPALLNNFFSAP